MPRKSGAIANSNVKVLFSSLQFSVFSKAISNFRVHGGTGKSHTTVLLTISAYGTCVPPYIIYKSLRLYDQWTPKDVIPGAVFNGTESGWVDESCSFDYLSKLFIPKTRHLPRPLLLILDNHSTHLSIKTAKLAILHDIHILCFPSHGTHILQPLDIYTFKYVKTQWRNLLWEYNKSSHNKSLDKADFVKLFAKLYNYSLLPARCAPAFAKAGIYPYDSLIIRREKLINSGADSLTMTANTNSLRRSLSVEFDEPSQPDCLTSTTSTTIKRNKMVRSLSVPILLSHINRIEKFYFVPTPRKIHPSKELEKLNKVI